MEPHRVEIAQKLLRLTYGLVPIVAGLDKFLNLLTDWQSYLSPAARALLPVSPAAFMAVVGVVEIAVGVLVLTKFTRLGAQLAAVWLLLIAGNLAAAGHFDVAVRDVVMAIGAWTLVLLSDAEHRLAAHSGVSAARIKAAA